MKIPVIKQLAENHSSEDLAKAEAALLEEKQPEIIIEGEDAGEQLTHVIAALWIKREMENKGIELREALRAYSQKVRTSIN